VKAPRRAKRWHSLYLRGWIPRLQCRSYLIRDMPNSDYECTGLLLLEQASWITIDLAGLGIFATVPGRAAG